MWFSPFLQVQIIAGLIVAYLFGSVSSAVLLCRWLKLPDPREQGSKNPGTTNVLRIAGKKLAASVLALDLLKGFITVWVASLLSTSDFFIASIGAMVFLGQLFPIFFKFRGGKGIAVTLGIILAWHWQLALFCVLIWLIIFALCKISSLSSLIATLAAISLSSWALTNNNVLAFNLGVINREYTVAIIILSIAIIYRHKNNIVQLLNNTEKTIV